MTRPTPQFQILDLDTVGKLQNGRFADQFREFMLMIMQDLKNRKRDKRARTVTMQIQILPVSEMRETVTDDTVLELVGAKAKIVMNIGIPKRETDVIDLGIDHQNRFYFNPESQANLNQTTFDYDAELADEEHEDQEC